MKRVLLGLFIVVLSAPFVHAYGPSIHMREAGTYAALCHLIPLPGPEHDPVLLESNIWFLRLGSIWPDIARIITKEGDDAFGPVDVDEGLVDPHNRHFNRYLLEQALTVYPDDPWKVALSVGCLVHNTGDLVAQDMLTQHMAVRAYTGEMDVIPGSFDTHAGGEVEGLVEGGLEFTQPAWWLYIVMLQHFIGSPEGQAELSMVLTYYLQEYEDYFDLPGLPSPGEALPMVEEMLSDMPWSIPAGPGRVRSYPFGKMGPAVASQTDDRGIDWFEVSRILQGPASAQEFWDIYYSEFYYLFSPMIMLTFESGQGYFDHYPNWNSKMMKSGMIQSLNHYLPEQLAQEDGRFLMDLQWIDDDTGLSIQSIDSGHPPSGITLTGTFYEVPGRTQAEDVVSLRVRADSVEGELVTWATADVGMDLWDFKNVSPRTTSVTFDPAPSVAEGAAGFFAEIAHGADPEGQYYFTTDWSIYTQIEEIDFTKDAYTRQYSSYDHWPYSLKILGEFSRTMDLQGRYPGH